jgi:ligand-binding sensor domain-containing protein
MPLYLRKLLIGVCLLLAGPSTVCGQQLRFEQFTTKNGLPSNETYTLLQDKAGYIWVCTNYGIVKYNGSSFLPVCTNIPFREQFAYCMYEHPKHGIWFANSNANIFRVQNDSAVMIQGLERTSKMLASTVSEINHLAVDDSLNIYAFSKGKSFKFIERESYRAMNLDSCYYKTSPGPTLLGLRDSFYPLVGNTRSSETEASLRIINTSGHTLLHKIKHPNVNKPRIVRSAGSSIYLSWDKELYRFDGNSMEKYSFPHLILAVTIDKSNNIWVGCYNGGLYKMDSSGRIIAHYFAGCAVNYVLFDSQDGMWVATTGKGLFHCRSINNTAYTNIPGLDQRIILVKSTGTNLFIATAQKRLYKLDKNSTNEISLPDHITSEITDIIPNDNGYFISTAASTYLADKDLRIIKLLEGSMPTRALQQINARYYFLNRTGAGKIGERPITMPVPAKAHDFAQYRANDLLIATDNGLYLASGSANVPTVPGPLKNITVTRLNRSQDGSIWACTRGNGLYRIDEKGKAISYSVPGKIVYDVCFPGDTLIAIACNKGTYINMLRTIDQPELWLELDKGEPITMDVFDGTLYVGTTEGLVSFDLRHVYRRGNTGFYLSKISAGNDIIASLPPVLRYSQNSPEFSFEHLDYRTGDNRLRYILSGPESRSGITEGLKLRLEHLPAGDYVLSVSPRSYGVEDKKNITLHFTVKPPYWATWWFIALASAGVISITGLSTFVLYSRAKKKAQKKAELSKLLAEYKLTALKAQINPHFMSNALSAIQLLVITNDTDKAGQYLAKFSLFIRNVLQYSDKSLVPLTEELKVIDLYSDLEMLRFKDAFEFRKEIDPSIDLWDTFVPPMITQPFVENAIWHGLLPLREKRTPSLLLRISKSSNDIVIVVEDNGVGRNNKLLQVKSTRESKGNEITRNRLEHINLLMGVSSASLRIEDLRDSEGSPSGTRVVITLPVNSAENEYEKDQLLNSRR